MAKKTKEGAAQVVAGAEEVTGEPRSPNAPEERGAAEPGTAAAAEQEPEPEVTEAAAPLAAAEGNVKMMFPKDVKVVDGGVLRKFKKGIDEVPAHLKGHWYLKVHGVTEVTA